MFTGLIEGVGELIDRQAIEGGFRLRIGTSMTPGLSPGGGQGWKVIVNNPTGGPLNVLAYAVCQAV